MSLSRLLMMMQGPDAKPLSLFHDGALSHRCGRSLDVLTISLMHR